jgi:pyrimidine deaminase RibD-like protein
MPAAERARWGVAVALLLVAAFLLRHLGDQAGPALRLQRRRERALRPKAIALFDHGWNPHYFVNPPAYTYALHVLFDIWFGGRAGVSHAYATNQTEVFIVARVAAAVLGTVAVGLLYLVGRAMFDRRIGLLAAGLLAVAFLPVFYSHLALNDVPTLAPICLSLWGTARILRGGGLGSYALAGRRARAGVRDEVHGRRRAAAAAGRGSGAGARALPGLLLAGALSILAFFVANPYAFIDHGAFHQGLRHQSQAADDALGKLGLTQTNGPEYYLWTFTWGLGWIPAIAALAGAVVLALRDRPAFFVLAPAPVLFVIFMGTQSRYFGRWLLPVFPIVCILAAYVVIRAADALGERRPALRPTLYALGAVLLCGQALLYSLHLGQVLSRPDTRNLAAPGWCPTSRRTAGSWSSRWCPTRGRRTSATLRGHGERRSLVEVPDEPHERGARRASRLRRGEIVNIEDYERELQPGLIDLYEQKGYCYVVSGSTQRGRAEAQPDKVPKAIAYYDELERRADKVAEFSPYRSGHGPVAFNFDWSFDFYRSRTGGRAGDDDLPPARRRVRGRKLGDRDASPRHRPPAPRPRDRPGRQRPGPRAAQPGRGRGHRPGREVLAEGWHADFGGLHAERAAIEAADGADLTGATLYVSLEPCCHQGKQPPCTEAIIEAGFARVVVASDDPSEKASGRGLGILRTRASRSTSRAASWRTARGWSTRRFASTRAAGGRGCSSSRR